MAKVTATTFTSVKPKGKCCRKSTRCAVCPVVLNRLRKIDAHELSDKKFTKALKKARAA